MTVLRSLEVDWLGKVEVLHDHTRTEVEVVSDNLNQLVGSLGGSAVGFNEDGKRLSDTNGVRKLHKGTASKSGIDEGLGDPPSNVGGGTVDLGIVLAGESTTTVGAPAAVGIDNNLPASKTRVTLRTTDDEEARRLNVIDGAVVEEVGGDDLPDDLLQDLLAKSLGGDLGTVLGTDNNGVDTEWLNRTIVVGVLDSDLGLGVRSEPWEGAVNACLLHSTVELVGKLNSQGQQFRSLIGGISEHDALVTGTQLLEGLVIMKTLGDVRGLLLDGHEDIAGLVIETLVRAIIANVLDSVTDNFLVVQAGLGGDFTEDHDHTCSTETG